MVFNKSLPSLITGPTIDKKVFAVQLHKSFINHFVECKLRNMEIVNYPFSMGAVDHTQSQPNANTKRAEETHSPTHKLTLEEQKRTILLNRNEKSSPSDLVLYFASYGKVVNVGTPKNSSTQTFVTFETVEAC